MKQITLALPNNDCFVENNVQPRHSLQSSLIFCFLVFYISMPNFEGPLRYYLLEHNIPWAIYFRDILVVLLCSWFILKNCLLFDYNKIIFYFLCILIFHSIIGLIYLPNIYMVLFGWKVFLPILVGLGSYYVFVEKLNKIKIVFVCLFVISVAGIFINYFVEFPWEGLNYTFNMYNVEGTRIEEITSGIKRLAGFNRFAFDAAIQIILLSIFLVVHVNNKLYKIIIWAVAGLAILLTTVKGIILSYLLISILLFFQSVDKNIMEHYKIYRKLFLILFVLSVFLPILSYFDIIFRNVNFLDEIKDMLFSTFIDRLYVKWPEAIKTIQDYGNLVLGRGLGGIGQSQVFFETYLFNSADNIFLYLYGQFGVFGGLYLFYFYFKSRSLSSNGELYFCLLVFIILQYGITQGILESPVLGLSVGFLLAHVNDQKIRTEYQCQLAKIIH